MHFSFRIFMSILTVVALVLERYFEICVLSEYFSNGDVAWFWLTMAFLWGQGIVLGAAILYCGQEDSIRAEGEEEPKRKRFHRAFQLFKATLAFLTCPLLNVLWHMWMTVQAVRKGDSDFDEKYDTTRRMRSLRVVAENAPQMFLQLYIVIIRRSEQGMHLLYLGFVTSNNP